MDEKAIEMLQKLLEGQEQLKNKVAGVENKVLGIVNKVAGVENQVVGIVNKVDGIENKVVAIGNQVSENTQILKALEHAAQVNKAEHDKMAHDVAHIKGDLEALRKDLSTVELVTASNYADIAKLKAAK